MPLNKISPGKQIVKSSPAKATGALSIEMTISSAASLHPAEEVTSTVSVTTPSAISCSPNVYSGLRISVSLNVPSPEVAQSTWPKSEAVASSSTVSVSQTVTSSPALTEGALTKLITAQSVESRQTPSA